LARPADSNLQLPHILPPILFRARRGVAPINRPLFGIF
jgi:hypothetical protein